MSAGATLILFHVANGSLWRQCVTQCVKQTESIKLIFRKLCGYAMRSILMISRAKQQRIWWIRTHKSRRSTPSIVSIWIADIRNIMANKSRSKSFDNMKKQSKNQMLVTIASRIYRRRATTEFIHREIAQTHTSFYIIAQNQFVADIVHVPFRSFWARKWNLYKLVFGFRDYSRVLSVRSSIEFWVIF